MSSLQFTTILSLFLAHSCVSKENDRLSNTVGVIKTETQWNTPNNIRICMVDAPNSLKNKTILSEIKDHINQEFQRTGVVGFYGWESCAKLSQGERDNSVRMLIMNQKGGAYAGFASVGPISEFHESGSKNEVIEGCNCSVIVYLEEQEYLTNPDKKYFRLGVVLHELGHSIGLMEEISRNDTIDSQGNDEICSRYKDFGDKNPESPYVRYVDPYDKNSIMNYCNNGNTFSESDIKTIRYLYQAFNRYTVEHFKIQKGGELSRLLFRANSDNAFFGMSIPEKYKGKNIAFYANFLTSSVRDSQNCPKISLVSLDQPQKPLITSQESWCKSYSTLLKLEFKIPQQGNYGIGLSMASGTKVNFEYLVLENKDHL